MSFYTNIAAVVAAQKYAGYCPPPKPPGFWDSWKGMVAVFLLSLAFLAGLLFLLQPKKKSQPPTRVQETRVVDK
jgi:hypothetical protein